MIISRTPFRVSFFGGGTDYPDWYRKHGGAVLATTIDKYCYINCRYLPPVLRASHLHRLLKVEHVQTIDEMAHPAVREALRFLNIQRGVEIHHDGGHSRPQRHGVQLRLHRRLAQRALRAQGPDGQQASHSRWRACTWSRTS